MRKTELGCGLVFVGLAALPSSSSLNGIPEFSSAWSSGLQNISEVQGIKEIWDLIEEKCGRDMAVACTSLV